MGWLTGYTKRIKLTVDQTKVDGDLTDFPVLVKLTSVNFNFAESKADGFDIRFTSSDGTTLLKFERERHDSVNQLAEYWVKIPAVSGTVDTDFYMYYGGSTWANYTGNPILAPNGHVKCHEPSIVYEDGGWTMWYMDFISGTYFDTYRARSTDGINFTDTPATPVLEDVIRINIKKIGGIYYAFGRKAPGGDAEANLNLYGWQSNDGISWTAMNSGNLIIAQGASGAWDYRLENPAFTLAGSTWKVLYEASNLDYSIGSIGYAAGTTFPLTKSGSNPIITASGLSWGGGYVATPDLVELPDSTYLLFVSRLKTSDWTLELCILKSAALDSGWVELPPNPILTVSGIHVADGAIVYDQVSGYLWLYYNYDQASIYLARYHGSWDNLIAAISDGASPTEVWDSNFKGVWHKKDLTTSTIADSTGVNNGTKKAANQPIETNGKIAKAQNYDGADDYITCGNNASLQITGALTIECLIKTDAVTNNRGLIQKYDAGAGLIGYSSYLAAGIIQWVISSALAPFTGAIRVSATTLQNITDYYIMLVFKPSTNLDIYLNGGLDNGTLTNAPGIPASIANPSRNLAIGADYSSSATPNADFFDGIIDECRISNIDRSSVYAKANYNSLFNTLLTYGGEETPITGGYYYQELLKRRAA